MILPPRQLFPPVICSLIPRLIGPGRVAQSVGHLTHRSGVHGSIPGRQHTFISPSAFSRRAVVSYWRKYVRGVLVNRLGGLSLPRKSVVRLTDRPDMTLDVYHGRKTTIQYNKANWLETCFWPSFHGLGKRKAAILLDYMNHKCANHLTCKKFQSSVY